MKTTSSDLARAMGIASTGMQAQSTRMRVIAENLANAGSTASTPDGVPYRRKLVTFETIRQGFEKEGGVRVDKVIQDNSDFGREYNPSHPSAGPDGYVYTPNVNSLIEAMDMREAQRSYEANLRVIELSRGMLMRTLDILRA